MSSASKRGSNPRDLNLPNYEPISAPRITSQRQPSTKALKQQTEQTPAVYGPSQVVFSGFYSTSYTQLSLVLARLYVCVQQNRLQMLGSQFWRGGSPRQGKYKNVKMCLDHDLENAVKVHMLGNFNWPYLGGILSTG